MSTARIKELVAKVAKANDDYYNKHNSKISDQIYDAWRDELQDFVDDGKSNAKLAKQVSSFLANVGAMTGLSEWRKVTHEVPMGSLNKKNSPSEFEAWAVECNAKEVFITEKLDGISIDTNWEKGELVQAVTRGNGEIGDEALLVCPRR